ncbi:MAG TPA: hypothetical protein DD384_07145 [Firmicutes bacterium]|nr:hypothetical protein [Bacillota bacterium]
MNIEIANRLIELRKKSGLSQEQLAEKLGLSRQAVSKWERAEASPDTDNLICLAKIYNVSLDELLNSDQSVEEIAQEVKEETAEKENEGDEDGDEKEKSPYAWVENLIFGICMGIVCIIYVLLGVFIKEKNMWALLWPLFLFPPVVSSLVGAIINKSPNRFRFPLLLAGIYCFIGMDLGLWHPTWVLFLAIPIYYGCFCLILKKRSK